MNDFASAAMLRLIRAGLQRQGRSVPLQALQARGAHVPLIEKRALLDHLMQAHGPQVLLQIGIAAIDAHDEPVTVALGMAREPQDLIERWQRLERFVHSRHRMRVEAVSPGRVVLRHVSRDPRLPPTYAEDLLVFGLLVALLHRLAPCALEARIEGEADCRWRMGRWTDAPLPVDASSWTMSWRPTEGARVSTAPPGDDTLARAQQLLSADASRRWSLGTLAMELRMSPRSLQRRLAERGSAFSGLVRSVRLALSARLLVQTQQPPAQIAYVCGFADQGHFNREFKRHSALTPAQYRREFTPRLPL